MRIGLAAVAVTGLVALAGACGSGDDNADAPTGSAATTAAVAEDAPTMSSLEVNTFAATATVGEWKALSTADQLLVAERWIAVEQSDLTPAGIIGAAAMEAELTDDGTPFREMMASIQSTLGDSGAEDDDAELPEGDPDVSYTNQCSYLLGDFTESSTGYRLVADVKLTNEGNVGAVNRVTVMWDQIGGSPVKITKTAKVGPRGSRKVTFNRVATSDEIDRHQSAGGTCDVRVSTVDTFGAVRP